MRRRVAAPLEIGHPLSFDRPERLTAFLQGATVLYNTYWVRFNYANPRLSQAIDNTRVLFAAARAPGIQRVVHISITNPSEDSTVRVLPRKGRTRA
jgi:NADH dehydrogenase